MGQTLENGIYLPSEGERNCYNGLASNWRSVDTNIGYISALRQAIAGALTRKIVTELPTEDIDPNCIYMILKTTPQTNNVYNEWMFINNNWELIGDTQLDLSDYYTKQEVDGKLLLKANDNAVVHNSGAETVAGIKSFSDDTYIKSLNFTNEVASTSSSSSSIMPIITTVTYTDQTASKVARINLRITASGDKSLYPHENNQYSLGLTSRKWSEVHATTYYYGSSDTEFSQKFVTTDTNQTVGGNKTFSSCISSDGSYLGNESSANERTNLCLRANRDTAGQSGAYIGRFRQNRAQGEMSGSEVSFITFDFLENSIRYTRCFTMGLTDWDSEGVPQTYYLTAPNGKGSLGTSFQKWSTINGLEPSALGMPDLSNGIDISSYFDLTLYTGQTYTPPVNGWVSISVTSPNRGSLLCESAGVSQTAYGVTDPDDNTKFRVSILVPCQKNQVLTTYIRANGGTINNAKFYPCQGNV